MFGPAGRLAARAAGAAEATRRVARRPVLTSFLAARAAVLAALALAYVTASNDRRLSLLGWDGWWYQRIAAFGYDGVPAEGIRFFPLLPILGRFLGRGLTQTGIAVLVLANVAALAYAALARRVALQEKLGAAAGRLPWLVALAPGSFVLAMGYTEALFGVAVCLAFLGARSRNWGLALIGGIAGGLLRPTGVLLCLPLAIEALRPSAGGAGRDRVLWRVGAAASPAVGLACYLLWCWSAVGDPAAPFRAQGEPTLRGGVAVDPLATMAHALQAAWHGHPGHAAPVVHLAWGIAAVGLLIVCGRRLPSSYTAFAAATLALALTARGFTSLERYATSALPLLLALAPLLSTARRRRSAAIVGILCLFGYAYAAFIGVYTP